MCSDAAEDSGGRNSGTRTRDEYTAAQTWPRRWPAQFNTSWVDFRPRRLCAETLSVRARRLLISSAGFCGIETRFPGTSSPAAFALFLITPQQDKTNTAVGGRPTRDHRLLAAVSTSSPFWRLAEAAAAAAPDAASFALICVIYRRDSSCTPANVRSHVGAIQLLRKRRLQPSTSFTLQVFIVTFLSQVSKPVTSLTSTVKKEGSQMNMRIAHFAESHLAR